MQEFILSPEEIAANYKRFREVINQFSSRKDRLNKMYDQMEDVLMTAPASSLEHFHNAFPGGYVDHVLRVYDFGNALFETWKKLGMNINFSLEELSFVTIHHDIGKLGLPGNGNELYVWNQSEWHRKNQGKLYEKNIRLPWMTTFDRGMYMLNHFAIPVTPEEMIAIRLTDGLYDESNREYMIAFDLSKKLKTNISLISHHADIMAARFEFERWATHSGKFSLERQFDSGKPLIDVIPDASGDQDDIFTKLFSVK